MPPSSRGRAAAGNQEFAYAHHKRLVEEDLARARVEHPQLGQLLFRPGTILGERVANQITAIFEKPVIIGISGSATRFAPLGIRMSWAILEGVRTAKTGIYNLAGDGVLTLREIATGASAVPRARTGTRSVASSACSRGSAYARRPRAGELPAALAVLSNERLERDFGYVPRRTTREVFDLYRASAAKA